MAVYLVLPLLIAFSYAVINVGSKNKISLAKIVLPLIVVGIIVYLTSSVFVPLVNTLVQAVTHLRWP